VGMISRDLIRYAVLGMVAATKIHRRHES
jgi:hypothetical protein